MPLLTSTPFRLGTLSLAQAPARKAAGALGLFKRRPILALLQDCHRAHAAFIARRVPHYTLLVLPLLVRDCLFVRIYLLISQLTSISRGQNFIRHLWTRVIAVSSATHLWGHPFMTSTRRGVGLRWTHVDRERGVQPHVDVHTEN